MSPETFLLAPILWIPFPTSKLLSCDLVTLHSEWLIIWRRMTVVVTWMQWKIQRMPSTLMKSYLCWISFQTHQCRQIHLLNEQISRQFRAFYRSIWNLLRPLLFQFVLVWQTNGFSAQIRQRSDKNTAKELYVNAMCSSMLQILFTLSKSRLRWNLRMDLAIHRHFVEILEASWPRNSMPCR